MAARALRRIRNEPVITLVDEHDEKTCNYRIKLPCPMCLDYGFLTGVVVPEELAVPCGCTSGKRLQTAVKDGFFPVPGTRALVEAQRIGLPEMRVTP